MARSQIYGDDQIQDDSISNVKIKSNAAIASSKLADGAEFLKRDGSVPATGDISLGTHKLTNVVDPTSAQDAATRAWVLAQITAIAAGAGKTVRMATTGNITLSAVQTVDGVSGSANDRVFVRAQTTPAENGIYDMKSGAWTRSADSDTWAEIVGSIISIEEGTAFADTLHLVTADLGGTLNTTSVTSVQVPGPADILAGAGLTRTGQTIDVVAADASLTVGANSVGVAKDAAGAITLSGTGLQLALSANKGLEIVSNAVGIKLDGATLTLGANGIKVTSPTPGFATRETPTGATNGSNTSFSLANTPVGGSEMVFKNGQLQEAGAGNDYTISGSTITYLTAPPTNSQIRVSYRY